MGFWSKVGKIAKVAAPFALDFIPGGQLAHLAMAGGLGAATSHGGLKSRLLGGLEGAGAQYAGNVLKGGKFNPVASGKRGTSALLGGVAQQGPAPELYSDFTSSGSPPLLLNGSEGDVARDVVHSMGANEMKPFSMAPAAHSVNLADAPGLGDTGSGVMSGFSAGDTPNPGGSLLGHVGKFMKDNPMIPLMAMSVIGGMGQQTYDPRRAFKGIDNDAYMKSLMGDFDAAAKESHQHLTDWHGSGAPNIWDSPGPGVKPAVYGERQIGGGLHTTPEDEEVFRQQAVNPRRIG